MAAPDTELRPEVAAEWIDRWDAQQEGYVPGREERFAVLADVVASRVSDAPEPVVVDLGCGPGSLTARLAARIPHARILGVDADPLLLALARARYGRLGTWVEADLADPATVAALPSRIHAAVSTTALHWMEPEALGTLYGGLAARTAPGGVFANGDHLPFSDERLAAVGEAVARGRAARAFVPGREDWTRWWDAALADPRLGALTAGRVRGGDHAGDGAGEVDHGRDHHGSNRLTAEDHGRLLRAAGYAVAGTVWQAGDDRIVVALR